MSANDTRPCRCSEYEARIEALTKALTARCSFHYGEDREDFPEVTHSHLGKRGWEVVPCALTQSERSAITSKESPLAAENERLRRAARALLDAMNEQKGRAFSMRVHLSADDLRAALSPVTT